MPEIITTHGYTRAARNGLAVVDDQDRDQLASMVRITMRRFDILLLAFCIMSTHYHLLVRATKETLAKAMKVLNYLYTVYYNERHGSTGHLFESPYRSAPKETEHQILSTLRYIHLNPLALLKPGQTLEDYPWSSHLAYLGSAPWDGVDGSILSQLSPNLDESRAIYRQFIEEGIPAFQEASRRKARLPVRKGIRTRAGWRMPALYELEFHLRALTATWPGPPPGLERRLPPCPTEALVLYAAVTSGLGSIRQVAALLDMSSSTAHWWMTRLAKLADRPEIASFFETWRDRAFRPLAPAGVGQ